MNIFKIVLFVAALCIFSIQSTVASPFPPYIKEADSIQITTSVSGKQLVKAEEISKYLAQILKEETKDFIKIPIVTRDGINPADYLNYKKPIFLTVTINYSDKAVPNSSEYLGVMAINYTTVNSGEEQRVALEPFIYGGDKNNEHETIGKIFKESMRPTLINRWRCAFDKPCHALNN